MSYNNSVTVYSRPFILTGARVIFDFDLFEQFIHYLADRKDTTMRSYKSCLFKFKDWLMFNEIWQPERDDIIAYKNYLTFSGLAADTQSQYLRAVKQFFKWTAWQDLYPNVADGIRGAKIRHDVHKKDALQREDVARIAATIDRSDEQGRRLYAMYLLCVICGLRTIEINRANVGDIKIVGGTTFLYLQGKGHDDKDAPVLLIPEVKEAIDDYLSDRKEKVTPKSPLFTSTSNRPGHDKEGNVTKRIAPTTISTMLKELLIKAGYDSDRLTAHSLRHTSGTGAHKAGIDLYGVQHLMRHCDPATSEIYIHDDNHKQAEEKGRQAIYDYYFQNVKLTPVLPELEHEIMKLSIDEQKALLEQLQTTERGTA